MKLLRRVLQFDSYGVDVRDNGEREDGRWFISKCSSWAGVCRVVIGPLPVTPTIEALRGLLLEEHLSRDKDRLPDPTRIPSSSHRAGSMASHCEENAA